ncbi:mandelate racemase/muconate lactonizing enzyme family protein [Nocardia sp. NBC_00508]|uniref:mandelate racemase/muconate lactonizing enzyme family protein n=1 Tax=Nocardia sp. NBC_00508 TaxID=2975992 RepID=UPI002E80EBE7|nr:mandelate racemase/muconate lactonizing enzyme family protein [Nocardia sp. NBC_00508]WUD64676.1 mandelate racemase/muconate lactonizing enzyme family protein [Nocardia sp. NBC_00508]
MKITAIRTRKLRLVLDPPFFAAWDPMPRRHFDATIVEVETDEGLLGIGSGDTMDGFAAYEDLFIGTDPLNIVEQVKRIETINFHAGRFWPLEVAFWDIIGKAANMPVAQLFGGAQKKVAAYASTGELRDPVQRAESALAIREAGFQAMKIRVDPHNFGAGLEAVRAVREAVGDSLRIMVDLNQSWRMAGDTQMPHDFVAARRAVEQLRDLDVYWVEEPLPYADRDGLRRLRAETGVRVAAGEMISSVSEVVDYLEHDALDVYQMDVVLAVGMLRARTLAELAMLKNRRFTPHSWTNGIGVLANLHVAAGVSGGPYFEFPYDPPGWTPQRRDFMLRRPVEIDSDGFVRVPDAPGIGAELDEEACRKWAL